MDIDLQVEIGFVVANLIYDLNEDAKSFKQAKKDEQKQGEIQSLASIIISLKKFLNLCGDKKIHELTCYLYGLIESNKIPDLDVIIKAMNHIEGLNEKQKERNKAKKLVQSDGLPKPDFNQKDAFGPDPFKVRVNCIPSCTSKNGQYTLFENFDKYLDYFNGELEKRYSIKKITPYHLYAIFINSTLNAEELGCNKKNDVIYPEMFTKEAYAKMMKEKSPPITKLLHMIWVGGKFPQKFLENFIFQKSVFFDYTICLHTDHTIEELKEAYLQDQDGIKTSLWDFCEKHKILLVSYEGIQKIMFFQDAMKFALFGGSYAELSDLLRLNLLLLFGGRYEDIDRHYITTIKTIMENLNLLIKLEEKKAQDWSEQVSRWCLCSSKHRQVFEVKKDAFAQEIEASKKILKEVIEVFYSPSFLSKWFNKNTLDDLCQACIKKIEKQPKLVESLSKEWKEAIRILRGDHLPINGDVGLCSFAGNDAIRSKKNCVLNNSHKQDHKQEMLGIYRVFEKIYKKLFNPISDNKVIRDWIERYDHYEQTNIKCKPYSRCKFFSLPHLAAFGPVGAKRKLIFRTYQGPSPYTIAGSNPYGYVLPFDFEMSHFYPAKEIKLHENLCKNGSDNNLASSAGTWFNPSNYVSTQRYGQNTNKAFLTIIYNLYYQYFIEPHSLDLDEWKSVVDDYALSKRIKNYIIAAKGSKHFSKTVLWFVNDILPFDFCTKSLGKATDSESISDPNDRVGYLMAYWFYIVLEHPSLAHVKDYASMYAIKPLHCLMFLKYMKELKRQTETEKIKNHIFEKLGASGNIKLSTLRKDLKKDPHTLFLISLFVQNDEALMPVSQSLQSNLCFWKKIIKKPDDYISCLEKDPIASFQAGVLEGCYTPESIQQYIQSVMSPHQENKQSNEHSKKEIEGYVCNYMIKRGLFDFLGDWQAGGEKTLTQLGEEVFPSKDACLSSKKLNC